jgi:integrase
MAKGVKKLADYVDEKHFFEWEKCEYIAGRIDERYDFPKKVADQHRKHLTKYILPEFGELAIDAIKSTHFEKWRRTLHLANATKNHIRNTFKIILERACADGHITANPIAKTKPVNTKLYRARDAFTEEEIQSLFMNDEAKMKRYWKRSDYLALFNVLARTGMRLGEVRGLCWEQIHWETQSIFVDRAINCDEKLGPTKTRKVRLVFLEPLVFERLQTWRRLTACRSPTDFVFPGAIQGRPYAKETLNDVFHSAIREAGVQIGNRNLVPHSFRHSFVTRMARQLPAEVVDALTGHATPQMRARYDHPTHDDLLKQVGAFKDRINGNGSTEARDKVPNYEGRGIVDSGGK